MTRPALVTTRKDLGDINRRQVLADIMFNGPIARSEIAKRVNLTQASVSRITRELIENGLVCEHSNQNSNQNNNTRPGRPLVQLKVNPTGGYVIGVAFNLFTQVVTIANLANKTLAKRNLKLDNLTDARYILDEVTRTANELLEEVNVSKEQVLSCGVAITGAVNPSTGMLRSAPSIEWDSVPVGSYLNEKLDLPIFVETVPNAKNLAEYGYGNTRNHSHVILLNAYHIIGASFFLNGELYRGFNFHAGVIENAPITTEYTKGAARDLVSGKAVLNTYYGKGNIPNQSSASDSVLELIDKANNGEAKAIEAFEQAATALAELMKLIKELLQPEMILLTGPVVNCVSYVNKVRTILEAHAGLNWVDNHFKTSNISSEFAAQSLALYKSISEQDLPIQDLMSNHKALAI